MDLLLEDYLEKKRKKKFKLHQWYNKIYRQLIGIALLTEATLSITDFIVHQVKTFGRI